jgi:hypothetical protein
LCPLYGFKAGAGDIARQDLAGRSFHSGNFSNFSLRLSGQSNSFQSAPHNEQAERWSSSERSATSTQMYAIKRACVLPASNVFQPRVGFVEAHQTVGETTVGDKEVDGQNSENQNLKSKI